MGPEAPRCRAWTILHSHPIETPHGLFRMSVDFAPSSTVTILKETTSPGPVAQVPPFAATGTKHYCLLPYTPHNQRTDWRPVINSKDVCL